MSLVEVVVADDNPVVRSGLVSLLEATGVARVLAEAGDGRRAIELAELHKPDLVLLDVRMPRLDGIAATARIKARWPAVRVVAHSLAVERRDDALAAGADAFVPKGAPTTELLAALGAGGTA